uniref:CHCH domain-containing protein n=1 Tax=Cucumis sativus TaxID=3659 RepID=A0A0A0L2G8_CUCSA
MDGITEKSRAVTKNPSPCDVEALKKCLQENNGDRVKCESQIQAFMFSCSLKKSNPSLQSGRNDFDTGV